jgi:hypothetical protein
MSINALNSQIGKANARVSYKQVYLHYLESNEVVTRPRSETKRALIKLNFVAFLCLSFALQFFHAYLAVNTHRLQKCTCVDVHLALQNCNRQ